MSVERVRILPDDRIGLMARLFVECTHCGLQLAGHDWLDVTAIDGTKGTILKAGMRRIECCSECEEGH